MWMIGDGFPHNLYGSYNSYVFATAWSNSFWSGNCHRFQIRGVGGPSHLWGRKAPLWWWPCYFRFRFSFIATTLLLWITATCHCHNISCYLWFLTEIILRVVYWLNAYGSLKRFTIVILFCRLLKTKNDSFLACPLDIYFLSNNVVQFWFQQQDCCLYVFQTRDGFITWSWSCKFISW